MVKDSYEIEVKTLLGSRERADELLKRMKEHSTFKEEGGSKHLNHYFIGGNLESLYEKVRDYLDEEKKRKLLEFSQRARDFSVRTRWADGRVILVVKATIDDTNSIHGTARLEWESEFKITIEELDKLVLDSGFDYQAKWSRERKEYSCSGLNVTIDKNAGYGYLAEFEKVINDPKMAGEEKEKVRKIMEELGVEELPQARLDRMFDHYNKNWQEYYGTEKTFIIH